MIPVKRVWRNIWFILCVSAFTSLSAYAQDLDSIRNEHRATYSKAMIEENISPIIAHYNEASWVMPEYQETSIGKEGANEYFAAYFERFDVSDFGKTVDEVIHLGEITLEIGSFKLTQTHRESSRVHEWAGTYFDVWESKEDADITLVSQGWNYDTAYEGLNGLVHFEGLNTVTADRLPGLSVANEHLYEIRALRELSTQAMMRNEPDILPYIYAEEAIYAPHDSPALIGRKMIKEYLKQYTAHWPPFDYVDSSTLRIDFSEAGILEHTSYSLRWNGQESTGVSTGKGIRLWKRSKDGLLQSYRQIAMNDK